LFSDEPASESVMSSAGSSPSFVDTFTSPSSSSNTINAIAANVLANGGEYNADQGIDASKPVDPFATAIAFSKYGSAIKGAASLFGLGSFFNVAQQQNANDIITEMEKWGGEGADKSNVGLSILGAGLSFLGLPLAGFISGESKDAVAAVKGLASQFETPEAMKGYFTAADEQATLSRENFDGNGFLGSMAGNLAKEGDINAFGQKVYDLKSEIDKGISSGKDLGQVQASLLDKYITPDTKLSYAIPTAVYSPALATATELGKLQESNKSLEQALADMQTGVAGQINTQGEQFQTLLDQYKELGMTQNEAIQQTINDLKTDVSGVKSDVTSQINTQGEQFQTLLNQYKELGMTQNEALQQTINDLKTDVSGVKSDVASLNFATPDDIVNALAELNYTTPEDIDAALANLNFTTPEDVINQLAESGLATTDDIANAIAELNIPTVDDIVSAIPTPVTETPLQPTTDLPPAGGSIDDFGGTGSDVTIDHGDVGGVGSSVDTTPSLPSVEYNPPEPIFDLGSTTPATSFQPANPDGSFVNPALNTPTSIIGDLFPEYGGMLTSPVVGAPISTEVPTPTLLPSAGGMFDTPEPAPVIEYNPPEPVFDTSSSTPTAPSAGSYWTDAAGNPIRSGDGGYVYSGSATAADRAAGTANPPSAPAPAPAPTIDWGGSSGGDSAGDSGGGGGYSSSADGGWGDSDTGEW
jgi:hypothetical protein